MIACDIDNTLSTNTNQVPRIINRQLELDIPECDIKRMTCLKDFQRHPAVRRFVDANGVELIEHLTNEAYLTNEFMETVLPLDGAVKAMRHLAKKEKIIYVTCRPPDKIPVTRQWLRRHGFPSSDAVYSCQHYHYKYIRAYEQAAPDEPIIIIDDMAQEVVNFFPTLIEEWRIIAANIIARLAVVRFYTKKEVRVKWNVPFPLRYLPSWQEKDIDAMLYELYQEIVA